MSLFKGSLRELEAAIDDVVAHLDTVRAATELRPRLSSYLDYSLVKTTPEGKELIERFFAAQVESTTTYQGLLVRLSACFETFLRRAIRESVDYLSAEGSGLLQSHDGLRRTNLRVAGEVLRRIDRMKPYAAIDYDALAVKIGSCHASSARVTLASEAFSFSVEGTSQAEIERALKLLGMSVDWQAISKHAAFDNILQGKPRERLKIVEKELGDLLDRRNRYAHESSGMITTHAELKFYAEFVRAFATSLAGAVASHLALLVKNK